MTGRGLNGAMLKIAKVCGKLHNYTNGRVPLMNMNVSLTDELGEFVKSKVSSGRYTSASEVVREALRDWTRHRDAERRDLEMLRAAIRAGLDSGPGIPADQVFAELRARYATKG